MSNRPRSANSLRSIIGLCLLQSWRQILSAMFCVLASTALALALPWPVKFVFDYVLFAKPVPAEISPWAPWLSHGSIEALAILAASGVLMTLFIAVFAYYQLYVTSRIGAEIIYRLRTAMFDHLQTLSLSFHSRARSGELLSKLVVDTNTMRDIYSEYTLAFVTHALTVVGMCAVMYMIQPELALVVMLTFPILFAVLFMLLHGMRRTARRQRSRESELTTRLTEVLGAVALVQAFGRERMESERFEHQSRQSKDESIRAARIEAAVARMVEIVRALGTALVIVFGGMQVLRGVMTPGDLLVFSTYIVNIYKPVRVMARLSARFSKASASAERIREVLAARPEIEDRPNARELQTIDRPITFEEVSFRFDAGPPVLDRISVVLPKGKVTALVGASGAGKTTFANLIVRLCDPTSGRILIGGVDLRDYTRKSLRQHIGMVLQETLLFGASIRENIAYGKPDATTSEIEQAARSAGAHEFICQLPMGYDELIGESGATLSGGQRQRISLARALIKKPSLLIMDEPTSALDVQSEAQIRLAVRSSQHGKTTLLIAHHLQSVQHADHIIVLRSGRIVEQGSHDELVRRNGYYCQLFQITSAQHGAVRHAASAILS